MPCQRRFRTGYRRTKLEGPRRRITSYAGLRGNFNPPLPNDVRFPKGDEQISGGLEVFPNPLPSSPEILPLRLCQRTLCITDRPA